MYLVYLAYFHFSSLNIFGVDRGNFCRQVSMPPKLFRTEKVKKCRYSTGLPCIYWDSTPANPADTFQSVITEVLF